MGKKHLFLAAAVAGLLSHNVAHSASKSKNKAEKSAAPKTASGFCKESNSCTGAGSCAGKTPDGATHDCKGKNTCANNMVKGKTKEECTKMKGEWTAE